MTKAQLIAAIAEFPDDMPVALWVRGEDGDPEIRTVGRVDFIPADDDPFVAIVEDCL